MDRPGLLRLYQVNSDDELEQTRRMTDNSTRILDRIRSNDQPDPYVAVYSAPEPYHTGTLVHMRWSGLLSPSFIKKINEIVMCVPDPFSHPHTRLLTREFPVIT